jgi:4-oxalocrotonate tautomerase
VPVIRVELLAGRTRQQKRAFTKAVTDAFVATLGGVPQSVHVIFHDVEEDDLGVAGRLTSDPAPPKPVECAYSIEGQGPAGITMETPALPSTAMVGLKTHDGLDN